MAIPVRILVQIVLVIVLGGIEVDQRSNLHGKWLEQFLGHLPNLLFDNWQLRRVGVVDARTVLCAHVRTLLVDTQRVNGLEIHVEQEAKTRHLVIVGHMHGLGEARAVGAYVLIGRILSVAVSIAHLSSYHALHLLEKMLGAPEAPASQINFLFHRSIN